MEHDRVGIGGSGDEGSEGSGQHDQRYWTEDQLYADVAAAVGLPPAALTEEEAEAHEAEQQQGRNGHPRWEAEGESEDEGAPGAGVGVDGDLEDYLSVGRWRGGGRSTSRGRPGVAVKARVCVWLGGLQGMRGMWLRVGWLVVRGRVGWGLGWGRGAGWGAEVGHGVAVGCGGVGRGGGGERVLGLP